MNHEAMQTVLGTWGDNEKRGGVFWQPGPFEIEIREQQNQAAQEARKKLGEEAQKQRQGTDSKPKTQVVTGLESAAYEALFEALQKVVSLDSEPRSIGDLKESRKDFARDPERVKTGKAVFEELIKRFDQQTPDHAGTANAIRQVQEVLKTGKNPQTGETLDEATRFDLHQSIMNTLNVVAMQVTLRMEYARFLDRMGLSGSGEKVALEAKTLSDKIDQQAIKKESELINSDMTTTVDPQRREQMKAWLDGENSATGLGKLPLLSRKVLIQMYLGAQPVISEEDKSKLTIKYGFGSVFRPDKAHELIIETAEKSKTILGFDPLDPKNAGKDPTITSLFAGLNEVLQKPENFQLNAVMSTTSVESLKQTVKQSYTAESYIVDALAATIGIAAAIRFGKPGALNFLSKTPALAAAARPAAVALGIGAGTTVRQVAYEAWTGQEESLSKSAMHALGAMGLVVAGGKVLGKGNLLTGTPGANMSGMFAKVDAATTAKVLSKHGFETTGKVSDFLVKRGLTTQAKQLAALPEEMLISEGRALEALQSAGLYGRNMSGLAEELISSGVKGAGPRFSPKFFTERFVPTVIDPTSASLRTYVRGKSATKFYAALAGLGFYRTTATALDYTGEINPQTNKPYTYLEAVKEVHLPGLGSSANHPWWQQGIGAIMGGTIGEAFMAAMMLGPKGLAKPIFNPNLGLGANAGQLINPARWLDRLDARLLAKSPYSTSLGVAGKIIAVPAAYGYFNEKDSRENFLRLLEMSQRPIVDQPIVEEDKPRTGN